MGIQKLIIDTPPQAVPTFEGCTAMFYYAIPKGVQAVIHITGSYSLVIVANPNNGEPPIIYEQHSVDRGYEIGLHVPEGEA